jgi:hypothetical protein
MAQQLLPQLPARAVLLGWSLGGLVVVCSARKRSTVRWKSLLNCCWNVASVSG